MDRRSEELVVGYNKHEKSVPPALRPLIMEIIRLRTVIGIADATIAALKQELGKVDDEFEGADLWTG